MASNEHNGQFDSQEEHHHQGMVKDQEAVEEFYGNQAANPYFAPVDAPVEPVSRVYFIKIPIRTLTGHVTEEHLHKLSLFLSIYGALLSAVGVLAILFPIVFSLAVGQFVAWLLVLGGILSLVQFFLMCGAPGTSSFLLLGILHMAIGLWIITKPISGGMLLIYVASGWFVGHGVLKLLTAYQVRNLTSWPAVMASGVLSFVLALVILVLSPRYGLLFLGVIFGVDLLVSGIAMMLIACMAYFGNRAEQSQREPLLYGDHAAAFA
ncbi:hypothetical protein O6H91_06G099200 [Diphasiastrum complanatum]|uniref:Uncharacterized protein n=1 Tax=Diphasiastrum complanatum TaxID=34168 RepID=A0ACC2DH06_DIPCM|nr:hypothetical protein O6H91_06G099200 [Diphasiastrum complanatum]